MKMLMTLPTNDKNLNSEIETIKKRDERPTVLELPMIRISILRLKRMYK